MIDISGLRFGRWLVLGYAGASADKGAAWLCRCDCGVERAVRSHNLRQGRSLSCGCYPGELGRMASNQGKSPWA